MSDPITVGINKLSLQPGDVVLVTVPDGCRRALIDAILDQLPTLLPPECGYCIKDESVGVSVLRGGLPVVPEVEPPIVVEVGR